MLQQRHGTVSFLLHAQGVVKMASYGDVSFKKRAGTETPMNCFFSTHHTAHIFLPQIFTCLKPAKLPYVGKRLGVMTRLLKKRLP
jgi:hypothetical protein